MKTHHILLIILSSMLCSCSIQPRRHMSGHHVDWVGRKAPDRALLLPNDEIRSTASLPAESSAPTVMELTADAMNVLPLTRSSFEVLSFRQQAVPVPSDSASCDTIVLLNGERISCIVKKVRSSKVLYRRCQEPDGAIISIARAEVASVSYHSSAEAQVNAPKRKLETVGMVGLTFAVASLICAIFLSGIAAVLVGALLGHLALILGVVSILNIYKDKDRYRGKSFGLLSIGLGYMVALFSMLFRLL